GEQTGNLPEVCAELEKYYLLQQRLWREFLGWIIWPAFQFFAGVLVIAGMLWILGAIAEANNSPPLDPLGLGLVGASGAVIFVALVFGILGAVAGAYLLASRSLRHQATVDALLLHVPGVGPCLRALAMTRFCLALRLTLETALSLPEALRLSLRATGNAAFVAQTETVVNRLRDGDDLSVALAPTRLFPEEFQHILAVAEEGGRVTEVMRQQADYYAEEAARRLTFLSRVTGFGVWVLVAVLLIMAIFRMFVLTYLNQIEQFL